MQYTNNYSLNKPQRGVDRANVDDLNENSDTIDELIHQNRTMIAQAYSQLESYVVGDIVENEGKLYRCIGATSGNWDSTKWTRTTLGDEVEEGGASALADLDDVSLTTPTEGQILTYNGDEWVNADAPDVDVTKTASGNPIEVSDSASAPLVKCVSAITGYQDLHGYDKPWVGGAGKNKFDPESTSDLWILQDGTQTHNPSAKTVTRPVSVGENVTLSNKNNSSSSNILLLVFYDSSDNLLLRLPMVTGAKYISGTAPENTSYVLASFYTWSLSDEQQLEIGVSFPTSYEPYSNICPITAYTEGKIEVGGRNLYPIKIGNDYFSPNAGGSASNDNGTLVVTTTSSSYSGVYSAINSTFDNLTEELVGKFTYSFYAKSSANLRAVLGITNYGRREFDLTTTWQRISMTATFPGTKLAFLIYSRASAGTIYIKDFMVERGDTPHEYEEYITPTTHTTTYPSAIYRGSEDVVNGTETHDMVVVDLGDYDWTIQVIDGNNCFRTTLDNKTFTTNAICSQYSFSNRCEEDGTFSTVIGSANHLFVRDSRYSTTAGFKTGVTGVKLAYQLATPTTSPISVSSPVKSLNGYSHIESSTGEMEIEYIAKAFSPITEIVDSQISALQKMMELMLTSAREATMTASANYTTGTLIVACGALYKATTAISSGASLVVGTNITPTTIAVELAALA